MSEDRLIGQQLDEYQIEKLLGQGGMAQVYRGLDVGLKRYAAIKIIDTPFRRDEEYLRRFAVEAQAIAQLDHPNIVSVYRYGQAQDVLYMAMKYVEGADLHVILSGYEKNGELMPWDDALRVLRDLTSALDYAHSKGVIHRDIKPSNIMLDGEGRTYLTDFGLVLLTAQGTQGQIFGTPQYIAPEQAISSAGAVPQSDLYAIGVILYRMVTGTLPFDHEDMLEIAMLHMTEEPPPPSQHRPEISYALENIILKSLAKEPRDRYPNGAALIAALEAIGQEIPPPAMAPALSILDRVALDREFLPPPPVSPPIPAAASHAETVPFPPSTPPPTTAAATVPTAPAKEWSPVPPKIVIGIVILLMLCLAAGGLALFSGGDDGENAEVIVMETAVNPTNEPTITSTIETAVNPTIKPVNENSQVVVATAIPEKTGYHVYLPAIASEADGIAANQETTITPAPLPTNTSTPLPTATPEPTATTPSPTAYHLTIDEDKDTLFITNLGDAPFDLTTLVFVFEEDNQFSEWETAVLPPESCILLVKEGKNASDKLDKASCLQSAGEIEHDWKDKFDVYYQGMEIGSCDVKGRKDCILEP